MSDPKPEAPAPEDAENLDEQLEEGLEESFPASDPPSVARRHRQPPQNPA
ncbi:MULTISPECIES: hypothetical protein [unclassified Caulobacter]|nr:MULTISPECIES: hypothetical protein [unclassified Caulobacter]